MGIPATKSCEKNFSREIRPKAVRSSSRWFWKIPGSMTIRKLTLLGWRFQSGFIREYADIVQWQNTALVRRMLSVRVWLSAVCNGTCADTNLRNGKQKLAFITEAQQLRWPVHRQHNKLWKVVANYLERYSYVSLDPQLSERERLGFCQMHLSTKCRKGIRFSHSDYWFMVFDFLKSFL